MDCLEPLSVEHLSPEKKKQKLEELNDPSSTEEELIDVSKNNNSDDSDKEKQELDDDLALAMDFVLGEYSSPEERTQVLGNYLDRIKAIQLTQLKNNIDSKKEKEELDDLASTMNFVSIYINAQERAEVMRGYLNEVRARRGSASLGSGEELKKKRKMELPKEKLESDGWYGIVMADDSDEYSDAEERAKDMRKYHDQVRDSKGFDVEFFPKARLCGMIVPVPVEEPVDPLLSELSTSAVKKYNEDHVADFHLERVLKSTARGCAGVIFYITFEAKEKKDGARAITFQACVLRGIPSTNIKVLSCTCTSELDN